MKRIPAIIPRFFLALALCQPAAASGADATVARLEKRPIPEFQPPPISLHEFPNGLKLYFLRNPDLPVLEMSALIAAGNIHDPADKKGVNEFLMQGLRTGGSRDLSGDEIDTLLDGAAAELSAQAGLEYSALEIRSLVSEADLSLKIFFGLLQNPRFDPQKMEITRERMLEGIRRRNEDPMGIAEREFIQQLYGPESVWARQSTLATVASVTRNDLVAHFDRTVAPNRILLAVSGDLPFPELIAKLKPYMDAWPAKEGELARPEPVKKEWKPSLQVIDRPVNQSSIILGHFGDKRFNPDKFAIILANQILGLSTFGSRLGTRIRTDLGLAYSVYSAFDLETDYGAFQIVARTKTASTHDLIRETRRLLRAALEDQPFTQEELDNAKQTILNQLIFKYADTFDIVEDRARYDFYGYPPDYLTIYQREIRGTTLDQVRKALQAYFLPDRLKILVVGDLKAMGDLKQLGTVETLPLDND